MAGVKETHLGRERREGEVSSPRRKRQNGRKAKENAAGPWLPGKGLERRLRASEMVWH